jgi:thiol-disulfide isomerase/thioredoxin
LKIVMTRARWTALIGVGLVALAAVWLVQRARERREPVAPIVAGDGTQSPVRLFREPAVVPPFALTDLDGRPLSSADWRGKVVLVNFWATWCPPCRAEIPDLIALQEKYRDTLVIVGISEDDAPVDDVKRFVREQKMNYPVAMSTPELRKLFHGVVALPTTFVIDPEGKLQQRHVGMLNAREAEAEARVLAGLDTTASVERVDSATDKVRLDNAAEVKAIPGVDLSHFSDAQRTSAVQALVGEDCTCGCGLTVAECRMDDPTCPVSLPLAQAIVKRYSAAP